MTAHILETRQHAALQIAVAALEQANGAEADDPISSHQFRLILETARRIAARCGRRVVDLAGDNERNRDG